MRLPAVLQRLPEPGRSCRPGATACPTTSTATTCPITTHALPRRLLPTPTRRGRPAHLRACYRRLNRPAYGADGLPLRLPGGLFPAPDPEPRRPTGWIHSPEPDRRRLAVGNSTSTMAGTRLDLSPEPQPQPARHRRQPAAFPADRAGIADLVGLPDLARDALAVLDRPHLAGEHEPQPAVRPGLPAGRTSTVGEHGAVPPRHDGRTYRNTPQPYNDGLPDNPHPTASSRSPAAPVHRSGVSELGRRPDHDGRASFDIKAYDNAWPATPTWAGETTCGLPAGSTPDALGTYLANSGTLRGRRLSTRSAVHYQSPRPAYSINGQVSTLLTQTFAHEGRMPPPVERQPASTPSIRTPRTTGGGVFRAQYPG